MRLKSEARRSPRNKFAVGSAVWFEPSTNSVRKPGAVRVLTTLPIGLKARN